MGKVDLKTKEYFKDTKRYVESAELIEVLTNTKGKRKGGTVNMCKAFEDHYKSGKNDGFRDGIKQGRAIALIDQIIKKINKSKSLETIALELEENPEDIQRFYNVAFENQNLSANEIYMICYK